MKKTARIGGAALACFLTGSAMAASPFSAKLVGLPAPGGYGAVTTNGYSYYTGPIAFSSTTAGDFTVFCTDLNHDVSPGGTYEYIFSTLTENGLGNSITEAVSNEIGQIASLYKSQTGAWAVAAQAAIWHLAYPGAPQSFADATVSADFNQIINATYINTGSYAIALVPYDPAWPLGGGPQEMVFGIPASTSVTTSSGVPETSTWVMMMLGFAGLGLAGRRRRSGSHTA
jgi:hypothetical protein